MAKHLEKTRDNIGHYATLGDLYRFKGFKLKLEDKIEDAIEYLKKSKENYEKAASKDARHFISAKYVEALILETEASKLVKEGKYSNAAEKYELACNAFSNLDLESSIICKKYAEFFKYISEGELDEAIKIVNEYFPSNYNKPVKEVIAIVNSIAPSIRKRTQELIEEAIQTDKGPSFEARVRELVMKFDGRKINGREYSIYPPNEIILYRYNKVENRIITPKQDEIGIVYDGKTPIEIDVLGRREELGRDKLLIAECKNRPMNKIAVKDVELLLNKAKLVLKRFTKISEYEEKWNPEIDYIFFVVGSSEDFPENVKEYARKRGVYLLNLTALNNLFKLFKLQRWR